MRFTEALCNCAKAGHVPVIPDFKVISPAEGELFAGRDIIDAARKIEQAGAPALSVVTETKNFGGSKELLRQIAKEVNIPILRKDFINSREELEETVRLGASAILLICACMSEEKLRELYYASLELKIEPLVEVHNREEMRLASYLGAKLVGINNRDILTLEKDGGTVDTTAGLATGKPKESFLISESGLMRAEDVRKAIKSGADAVLVGTAIWSADNPMSFYRELSYEK